MESCIIHFSTAPPCSSKVDVLETGDVPILFSLPQMKHLGMTIEVDQKGHKITCPAFGLYSSPAEYSTMGHIVLDLTSLAYQPTTESREQPGHPKRHVTFAMLERKPAYPAHAPDMHEDEDEDDKPLVRPASRKEPAEERRDPATGDTSAKKKTTASMARPNCHAGSRGVRGHSLERAEDVSTSGRKAEGEAPRNLISKLSDERNLRDVHLKHYHMSTAQFKKRATHLDIPGTFYDLQHVVKPCSFCNSIKPRPERSRVSGLRAEEFRYLIFLDRGSAKIGDKTLGFQICFG